MINIIKQEHNIIHYNCSCGVMGMCSFKPADKEAAIVIDIKCPSCDGAKRLTLLQYNSENSKEEILKSIDAVDLSWVPTFNEEI